ncbi:C-C motif chemokine 20 [Denticeps clupeoides]|uniref:Chemokine interleukin-8-like domain-containing protein n=1 Tax=Denticeps clupeoides TaxID=299321 RepID=A0AAY4AH46_9TELE|nr:C-C motif chemokine 20-like [Denticeps clupeoides]
MASQSLAISALVFCCILSMLPSTPASYGPLNLACCVKYTMQPVAFRDIKGIIFQSSREACRLDAVIFHTKQKKRICASAEHVWVQKILLRLSKTMKSLPDILKKKKNTHKLTVMSTQSTFPTQ